MLFLPKSHPWQQGGCRAVLGTRGQIQELCIPLWGTLFPAMWNKPQSYKQQLSSDDQRDLNLPVLMDLKKSQGFQRPIQRKGNFHLHCLLGNVLRLLKLLKGPDFPKNLLPQRIWKSCPSPREVQKTNSCYTQPAEAHVCHLCPGEWDFAKETLLSFHLQRLHFFPPWKLPKFPPSWNNLDSLLLQSWKKFLRVRKKRNTC